MSPPFRITGGGRGPFIWRALVILCCIGVAVSTGSSLGLFNINSAAIDANTDLACRVGAFFVGAPVIRQRGESRHDFHHSVAKAEGFLVALKQHDCSAVRGARITPVQIRHELRALRKVVPRGGGSSSGSPSASPPGGGTNGGHASPSSSPPPHRQPPPTTTTAPPPVTTTTTTTTAPAPPDLLDLCLKNPTLPVCLHVPHP